MGRQRLAKLFLRLGLAFTFLYVAIASFVAPTNWIGYLPPFLTKLFPAQMLLVSFSIYEIILALWLLSGKKIFFAALALAILAL